MNQKARRVNKMAEKKHFIQEAIKKPGALRESLHVKKGEKIPEAKLEKAEHSKNPKTKKERFLQPLSRRCIRSNITNGAHWNPCDFVLQGL